MARVTQAAPHLSADAVKRKMDTAPTITQRSRWRIVYNALVEPRSAKSIALHTGVSVPTVRAVISRYNRYGPVALDTPGKGGRRNQHLSLADEAAFLAPFFERAAKGQVATRHEIQAALEARLGCSVHHSVVYRLLHRHGWRKLAPRSRHPKADDAEQEAFKKTSLRRLPR